MNMYIFENLLVLIRIYRIRIFRECLVIFVVVILDFFFFDRVLKIMGFGVI